MAIATAAPLAVLMGRDAEARTPRHPGLVPPGRPNLKPPPPKAEVRPPARRWHVWVAGHWVWSSRQHRHIWMAGRWVPARRGFRYRQPRWIERDGQWLFVPGGWIR
ncbi:hypothetical protein [Chelatococcus reniformis]|uniref:hypothetical protein n=1 Tax=Chelatococcus reniformis TaxID=1494448 RepID=UPI001FCE8C38|nr:hypothetical protein [Chelatococcus reniformis]